MPRTNLLALMVVTVLSVMCYQRVVHNPYGRYFAQAMDHIHEQALEPLPKDKLFAAAISGMTDQLDEYSGFIPRQDVPRYTQGLNQHLVGVGIEVYADPDTEALTIGNSIIGTPHPAWDAGLRPGDRIVAINGQDAREWTLQQAIEAIKGPAGEPVRISVLHEGQEQPVELSVVRSHIDIDSVLGDYRGDDHEWVFRMRADPRIAYIRLKTFGDHTADELRKALDRLEAEGRMSALILDLRDNSGGYLTAATEICDMFIDRGVIVTTRDRNEHVIESHKATAEGTLRDVPMVVLVNHYSASASEIVAACLQDHDRATLVGTRTWGKGSVQRMIPLERGKSILKLTTATYWRPSGENIHRLKDATEEEAWGVRPAEPFRVPVDDEAEKLRRETRQTLDRLDSSQSPPAEATTLEYDPQLKRAVKYLREQLDEAEPASRAA